MKKIILLFTLSALLTSCYTLEMSDYRGCSYDDKDGLYYDYWSKYPERVPCTSFWIFAPVVIIQKQQRRNRVRKRV